jgi:hypothetical protein
MKMIKNSLGLLSLASLLFFASCGKENNRDTDSGSDSQTTPNDSSEAESRSAMGVGDGNQNDTLGYPSNQSNLNSPKTSRLHDDTTSARPQKDKPHRSN